MQRGKLHSGPEVSSPAGCPAVGRCLGPDTPLPTHRSMLTYLPTFPVQELEKAKIDPLHGLRVHAWVLVLSGKREVPESFFIDPLTARSYSTQDDHFLGIESLWNHKNYWVNMQDCWNGCKVLGPARGQCDRQSWGGVRVPCGASWLPQSSRLSPGLSLSRHNQT